MKSIFLKAQDSGWYPIFLKPVVESVIKTEVNRRILDIGTGPGTLPALLIKQDPSLQITGIDTNNSMIEEARKRVSHKNIIFQHQAANEKLKFRDNEFDIITFCSVLFLLGDNTKIFLINEALRVLRPSGRIIFLTPTGQTSILSSVKEMFTFQYSINNWTYLIWKTFTSKRGKEWQKQKFVSNYSTVNNLQYNSTLTFNNTASLEILIISKSNI